MIINKSKCTIQKLAQLIRKLVVACPAIEYGWLHTKTFKKIKIDALKKNNDNYKKIIILPKNKMLDDLNWWKNNLKESINFIKTNKYDKIIYTDASSTGWRATDLKNDRYGFWNEKEKKLHINYLELLTIKIALTELGNNLHDCQILLRVDNTTAICYINRMGGVKNEKYHLLAKEIWDWAKKKHFSVRFLHCFKI